MPVLRKLQGGRSQPMRRNRSVRAGAMATVLLLLLGALGACEARVGEQADPRAAETASSVQMSATPRRAGSPASSGSATPRQDVLRALPALPTRRSATRLAAQISAVEGILGDPDARSRDVRRAAEFGQLAARLLASAPKGFRRDVLVRLAPRIRKKARLDVEAAALLDAITSPQPRLPEWRVVAPLPAQELRSHYLLAARRTGVPWTYLAAIHLVETRMGRIRGASSAGAQGPMQFLPTTWDMYGEGGDINDPRDAILAAARLLRANGAPDDMARAIWHYNPSRNYVGAVTRYAEAMRRSTLAYRGYWHWRVLYKHVRGTYVLHRGYPNVRARLLD